MSLLLIHEKKRGAASEVGEAFARDVLLFAGGRPQGLFLGELGVDPKALLADKGLHRVEGALLRRGEEELAAAINGDLDAATPGAPAQLEVKIVDGEGAVVHELLSFRSLALG